MGIFRRFWEFLLQWEAGRGTGVDSGVLTGELRGCWAVCHVEKAFPGFLLVKALLCRPAGIWGGVWVAGRCSPRAAPGHSAWCLQWSTLSSPCLSELAGMQGFAGDAEPLQAGGYTCVPLPRCCWPVLIPCSSEYDFEICRDESKLVRPAGRFHSWSALQEMLSLNYAQGMDFQVAFLSFFPPPPVLLLKNSASNGLYTEGSGVTATKQRCSPRKSITLEIERIRKVAVLLILLFL